MLTSTRYQIQYPQLSDSPDVPRDFAQQVVQGIERSAMYGQGTLANRPTSTPGSPGIAGRFYYASDQPAPNLYYDFGTGWILVFTSDVAAVPLVPVGATLDWPWASGSIPTWAVLAYGQVLTAGAYPAMQTLADASGRPYGGVAGTNFNLPDFRGRVGAGKDDMGGTAAARLTAAISGINGTVLGAAGGTEGVALTTGMMPAHNHSASADTQGYHGHGASADTQGAHSHGGAVATETQDHTHNTDIFRGAGGFASGSVYSGQVLVSNPAGSPGSATFPSGGRSSVHNHGISTDGSHSHNISIAGDGYHSHTISVGSAGGGATHTNVPPSIVVNKLMRVL